LPSLNGSPAQPSPAPVSPGIPTSGGAVPNSGEMPTRKSNPPAQGTQSATSGR
jgi:hypothetical protein